MASFHEEKDEAIEKLEEAKRITVNAHQEGTTFFVKMNKNLACLYLERNAEGDLDKAEKAIQCVQDNAHILIGQDVQLIAQAIEKIRGLITIHREHRSETVSSPTVRKV